MTGRTPTIFVKARQSIEELDRNCLGCFDADSLQKCVFCPVEAERQKVLMDTMVVAQQAVQSVHEVKVS